VCASYTKWSGGGRGEVAGKEVGREDGEMKVSELSQAQVDR
jgi:hypothetical protein